jgi:hypothetical protein
MLRIILKRQRVFIVIRYFFKYIKTRIKQVIAMDNEINGIEFNGLVIGLFRAKRDKPKKTIVEEIKAVEKMPEIEDNELIHAIVGNSYDDWADVREKAAEMAGIIPHKPKLIKNGSDHDSIMKMSSG